METSGVGDQFSLRGQMPWTEYGVKQAWNLETVGKRPDIMWRIRVFKPARAWDRAVL
ncbi:MAG: hypothetical protein KDJ80_12375 [Nitratireductor sp.]|nr:hypothetical protein [Nitratireductor sp.]